MNIVININNRVCRLNTPGGMLLAASVYICCESVAEKAIFVTAHDGQTSELINSMQL